METQKIKWWQATLIIILSITFAWWLTVFIGADIASLSIFTPSNKRGDFKITDIYNAVEMNNIDAVGGRPISEDVVVVSIDQLDRKQTLDAIHKVLQMKPSSIGLDFPFEDSVKHRDYLIRTLQDNPQIVSATKIAPTENGQICRQYASFYEKDYDVPVGFVNIDAAAIWNVIRTFHPYVVDEKGDTIPNIALALARLSDPQRAAQLVVRHNTVETIDYVSRAIEIIPSYQLDDAEITDKIAGKAVLMGDVAYTPDIRITPLHEPMAGILIHAYALQTVLSGSYIERWPNWIIWTLAFGLSLLFVLILQAAKGLSNSGNWLIRMSQFILMFGLVMWGCYIFSVYHTYADFTTVIALLGFSALAFDIAYAMWALVAWIQAKMNVTYQKSPNKRKKS